MAEWDPLEKLAQLIGDGDGDERTDLDGGAFDAASPERRSYTGTPTGEEIARGIIGHVDGVLNDPDLQRRGAEMGEQIVRDIQNVVSGDSQPHFGADSTSDHSGSEGSDSRNPVKFGAGTCYRCGGKGYTTWTSSGSQEACWYCNGSGIAR
jgi:DnaJ-class molecular chaperone